jgi:hypothetical protein
VLVSGLLVVGFGACGGDDDSEEAEAPQTQTTATEETTTETTSEETAPGGLTAPGTELSFGDKAIVGWNPPSRSLKGDETAYKLEVVVESLETGDKSDLEDVDLDAELQDATPYYLKVKVTSLGEAAPGDDDPDITFDAIDDRGQEQGSVTFIGDFPPCEDEDAPKPFSQGESYESCLTFLVPGGGSIEEVRWGDGPADEYGVSKYFEEPIVWTE